HFSPISLPACPSRVQELYDLCSWGNFRTFLRK
ncbi:MAG: hypothetical protein ACI8ZN_000425, partial [Bacteroidia bacterium]